MEMLVMIIELVLLFIFFLINLYYKQEMDKYKHQVQTSDKNLNEALEERDNYKIKYKDLLVERETYQDKLKEQKDKAKKKYDKLMKKYNELLNANMNLNEQEVKGVEPKILIESKDIITTVSKKGIKSKIKQDKDKIQTEVKEETTKPKRTRKTRTKKNKEEK